MKIYKIAENKEELKITPVIKKERTIIEKYEVCPHCMKEIGEKETYIDKDNYVFHRMCMEKGPIDKLVPKRWIGMFGYGD